MIQVIDRACAILELLAAHPHDGLSVGALAGRIAIQAPTCANILRSLADHGLVEQRRSRGPWFIGPTLGRWSQPQAVGVTELLAAADPLLADLAETIGGSVEIVELRGAVRIHHRRAHADRDIQVTPLYDHKPLLLTGSGRLLLAYSETDTAIDLASQQSVRLDGSTGHESQSALAAAFAAIRRSGQVAIHDETGSDEVSAGAIPLRWYDQIVLALGWYMPRSRCDDHRLRLIHSTLRAAASTIEDGARALEHPLRTAP